MVYSRAIAAFVHYRRVGGEIEDARRWQQDFQKVWNKKEQCDIIIQRFRDDAITKWTEAANTILALVPLRQRYVAQLLEDAATKGDERPKYLRESSNL